jgi:hypothetical protein
LLQFFPLAKSTNPPPPELIGQVLPRTNLVYYHWEWTQERLGQWQLMSKALPIFPTNRVAGISANSRASSKPSNRFADETWLSSIAPLLGNTITEATVTGENEIQLTRKSALGFTGFELLCLAHWMNDPQFPVFGLKEFSAGKNSRKK